MRTTARFHARLQDILAVAQKSKEGIGEETERNIIKTFNAYITRRTDRNALIEFAKQVLNLGLILTGLQTFRLVTYGTLSLCQRIQRNQVKLGPIAPLMTKNRSSC